VLAITVMSLLLVWRHEANIRKLLAGTESKLGHKAGGAAAATPHAHAPATGHGHSHKAAHDAHRPHKHKH
jgi:acyl phosphate:glycerol-3-phosphate acyltransferase